MSKKSHSVSNSTPLVKLSGRHLVNLTLHREIQVGKVVHNLLLQRVDFRWNMHQVYDSFNSTSEFEYNAIVDKGKNNFTFFFLQRGLVKFFLAKGGNSSSQILFYLRSLSLLCNSSRIVALLI